MPRAVEFDNAKVLDSAMDLFWKKGYHATSMQDLTEATGLNRSSLYNTFGCKMQLYRTALTQYQKQNGSVFQKALMKAGNPREAIELIFEGFLRDIANDKEKKGCFNMNCKAEMSSDPAIRDWLSIQEEQHISFFEGLISDGQERGLINERQGAREYAFYVFNTLQGLRMTGILIQDQKVLNAVVAATLRTLR